MNASGVLEEEVLLQVYPHGHLRHAYKKSLSHCRDRDIFLYSKKGVDAQETMESVVVQPFLAIFFTL